MTVTNGNATPNGTTKTGIKVVIVGAGMSLVRFRLSISAGI